MWPWVLGSLFGALAIALLALGAFFHWKSENVVRRSTKLSISRISARPSLSTPNTNAKRNFQGTKSPARVVYDHEGFQTQNRLPAPLSSDFDSPPPYRDPKPLIPFEEDGQSIPYRKPRYNEEKRNETIFDQSDLLREGEAEEVLEYDNQGRRRQYRSATKPKKSRREEEDDEFERKTRSQLYLFEPPSGLATLRKRPVRKEHQPKPDIKDVPIESEVDEEIEKPPSPPRPPQVEFKESFGNPMLMKISYMRDSILIAVSKPQENENWVSRFHKRLETLDADEARAEYIHQNKMYIDRPDWGFRIIIGVPESHNWTPKWQIRQGASKSEGHATPIIIPSPTPSPIHSTIKEAEASTTKDTNSEIPKPTIFGIPKRPPASIHTDTNTTTNGNTTPSLSPPSKHEEVQKTENPSKTPPSASPSFLKFTPFKPKTNTEVGAPSSTTNSVAPKTPIFPKIPASAPPPSTIALNPQPSQPPPDLTQTPLPISAATPSATPPKSNFGIVSTFPSPTPSSVSATPSHTSQTPSQTVLATNSASNTPSKRLATLSPQIQSLVSPWIPEELATLPTDKNAEWYIPGPGTSDAAYASYEKVMTEYSKYKSEMVSSGAEAEELRELVNDISNKIGATPDSFREKLGEHRETGFDGKLASLKSKRLLGEYYYALEYFTFKIVSEVTLNKALEAESNSIKYGERVVYVLQRHPLLEVFVKYHLFTRVPYCVPLYPQRKPGQKIEEWKTKEMAFKGADKELEDYLKRTRRLTYFFAAIMNTAPPGGNAMGINTAWTWLARMLALPRTEICIWYLEPVVKICARRLMFAYGSQWNKMAETIKKYVSLPKQGNDQVSFYESTPLIGSILVNLDKPAVHTPIQANEDLENLLKLRATNSYKMEFEEGLYISPQQLDITEMMSDEYHRYLDSHQGDIVDDLLIDVAEWDAILERVDSGQLTLKEAESRQYNRSGRGGRGGGRGGRGRGRY